MIGAASRAPSAVPVSIDLDGDAFVSVGSNADGDDVVLIHGAIVLPEGSEAPARAILLAEGRLARMASARAGQGLVPFRADARWDGVCWQIDAILPEPRTGAAA